MPWKRGPIARSSVAGIIGMSRTVIAPPIPWTATGKQVADNARDQGTATRLILTKVGVTQHQIATGPPGGANRRDAGMNGTRHIAKGKQTTSTVPGAKTKGVIHGARRRAAGIYGINRPVKTQEHMD